MGAPIGPFLVSLPNSARRFRRAISDCPFDHQVQILERRAVLRMLRGMIPTRRQKDVDGAPAISLHFAYLPFGRRRQDPSSFCFWILFLSDTDISDIYPNVKPRAQYRKYTGLGPSVFDHHVVILGRWIARWMFSAILSVTKAAPHRYPIGALPALVLNTFGGI